MWAHGPELRLALINVPNDQGQNYFILRDKISSTTAQRWFSDMTLNYWLLIKKACLMILRLVDLQSPLTQLTQLFQFKQLYYYTALITQKVSKRMSLVICNVITKLAQKFDANPCVLASQLNVVLCQEEPLALLDPKF